MRKEIVDLSQKLEELRIRNMAWWHQSEAFREEAREAEPVLTAYWSERQNMKQEQCELLDRVEEELYLMNEAELLATYMQGISDCLDYLEKTNPVHFYKRVS